MAGRNASSDLFTALLDKIGLAPAPKKKKKKKRPAAGAAKKRAKTAHLPGVSGPYQGEYDYLGDVSPFEDYGQAAGLVMNDHDAYVADVVAGYAPTPDGGIENAFAETLQAAYNPPPAATAADPGRLFSEAALDASLDDLFAGLEGGVVPETTFEPPPAAPTADAVMPLPAVPAPEGARMPIMPAAAPEVAPAFSGPAPWQAAPEPASFPAYEAPEVPASGLPALVLSQGCDLRTLLATIDRTPGVEGSLLVGYDGLLIASTLPPEAEGEYLAAQACNLFTGNAHQLDKLKRGKLKRVELETASGAMLMTAADMGILVIVSGDGQSMDTRTVMAAIAGATGRA